ncbi:adhesion G protein-coupled receptor L2-like [Clytia hemisphaerica]|uniref:G-protein coupled receptors family 2 profile 2 domain-containing protein n=1 Tax=Clytia hemisphaerica TaxID=252671 RepID=A0A7M5WYY2_9CNID
MEERRSDKYALICAILLTIVGGSWSLANNTINSQQNTTVTETVCWNITCNSSEKCSTTITLNTTTSTLLQLDNQTCFRADCMDLKCAQQYLKQTVSLPMKESCVEMSCLNTSCIEDTISDISCFPKPTSTSAPTTTTTTTKSMQQLRQEECDQYKYWLFKNKCSSRFSLCAKDVFLNMSQHIECLEEKGTQHYKYPAAPMLLIYHLIKYTKVFMKDEVLKMIKKTPFPIEVFKKLVWYGEESFRMSDIVLPGYHKNPFKRSRRRWNGINDTLTVPYGNILRGDFIYNFAMFDQVVVAKQEKEKYRLKDNWPDQHPISNGEYISFRSETGWKHYTNHVINSIVVTFDIEPAMAELPTYNTIAFTHKDRKMVNPICVYWQPLNAGKEGADPEAGYWTNYHMKILKTNKSMTVCKAYTFGSFAVLMEPYVSKNNSQPLDVTEILFLAFISFSALLQLVYLAGMFSLKCHKNSANRLYIYANLSLFMMQVLIVFSFRHRDDWEKCAIYTGWIQFFFINILSWLMMESVHRLSNLLHFFHKDTNRDFLYHIVGLGIPLSNMIAMQGFPYDEYSSLRICWVYANDLRLWYFINPITAIICASFLIKFITFKKYQGQDKFLENDFNYQQAQLSVFATGAILPTLLIGWTLMSVSVRTEAKLQNFLLIAASIAQVCLGLQVLYFYFYRNHWVVEAMTEEKRIKEKKKLTTLSFLKGLPIRIRYKDNPYDAMEEKSEDSYEMRYTSSSSLGDEIMLDESVY